ncbi:TonB-dependent receptor plug domain-containing protein [Comamonas composti]|uniref:TonB-dependent receptor plug domain-containing protein n=1 Tax=Comamonas composti TaxID=408558 RepID=UPI00054D314A|nr:TonB-dependent receptor [Comamonas composti]
MLVGSLALCGQAQAQETSPKAFELGVVDVHGQKSGEPAATSEQRLDAAQLELRNADTVADAVRLLPGVSLSRNSRNEEMINVRGFDSRQVPVYVDGIPLYVPYDGYVDFGRFTTFDLAEVRVAKAGASLMYGPNTLGGAINLVTRKPSKPFEGDIRLGAGSGSQRKAAVNLGGNLDTWYYQIGASYLDADSFPLPKGFKDFKKQPTDTGDKRENAYRTDKRLSFKIGLTPNATDEYALGYVHQEGEKGNPVYTGTATGKNVIRYWRWPYWDKDSVYLLSNTRIGENNLLKARIYHDSYKNGLDMYTDASYSRHDPTSSYKDVSKGASLEWSNYSFAGHELRFGAHYKIDEHTDAASTKDPQKHYRDVTYSLVAEDTIALAERWSLNLAVSHERREAREVHLWPTGSADATNGVAKLGYALGKDSEAYVIASHKTRFPTIKDRYSARMGTALPSPDLQPETANHLELGVSGKPWEGGLGQAALFYSRVRNQIQSVVVPSAACGGSTCNQAQNVGRTRNLGLELSLAQELSAQWGLHANYTYLSRRNTSDSSITLTNTPRHRLLAGVQWRPHAQWELNAEVEAEKGRYVSLAGSGQLTALKMSGFGTTNLRARYKPRNDINLDVGVSNLGDKWYQFDDGLPMPGRMWYVNLGYKF